MGTTWMALCGILLAQASGAGGIEKMYYLCEVKLSSESGQPRGSQVLLLEKTHDPDKSLIVERAISVTPDKKVDEFVMYMTVKDDSFTIKDDRNTISGSGRLFGPAWRWTYFKGNFESTAGVRIEDENFMSDPAALVARKKITDRNGKVLMYMDVVGKVITPETFEMLSSVIRKK